METASQTSYSTHTPRGANELRSVSIHRYLSALAEGLVSLRHIRIVSTVSECNFIYNFVSRISWKSAELWPSGINSQRNASNPTPILWRTCAYGGYSKGVFNRKCFWALKLFVCKLIFSSDPLIYFYSELVCMFALIASKQRVMSISVIHLRNYSTDFY